ncbi:septal ring lytic transglycosylase RlpA family protein [Thalassotalea sp. ND16A]|uniref:septal ring lytic transglycosylase RlpA family protein n=1 Tax=Thalassotalea sp. ND16A TaxID=1535422 RepID=UPI0006896085|nr:septal ring lytic transglycosylase RlpA family protein [Thalassotalea sp. ND16A]
MHASKFIFLAVTLLLLNACSTTSRYSQKHDSIPDRLPSKQELEEPTPQIVPPSRGGNKDYQVFGKSYQVLPSADGYKATGIASWYGKKFHGHLTSNGEVYDMYAFSAAHKALPLPTYLQVTNIANNKSVIVRVNDRGPFHQERLIDLSYSAAYKLGMLTKGTAQVKIEAITKANIAKFTNPKLEHDVVTVSVAQPLPKFNSLATATKATPRLNKQTLKKNTALAKSPVPHTAKAAHNFNRFIHVLETRDKLLAKNTAKGMQFLLQIPVKLSKNNELFRVQVGPIDNAEQAKTLLANIQQRGYSEAYPLKWPK